MLSGSGPTCAFLARDEEHALDLAVALSSAGVCRRTMLTVRSAGTKTSRTLKWCVPVPRMPRVCHVSRSSASPTGTSR